MGLRDFYYNGNPIHFVDNVEINKINFNLDGYQAIRRIQLRMKRRFKNKLNACKIIQEDCHDWIWKPMCNDGTRSIDYRFTLDFYENF